MKLTKMRQVWLYRAIYWKGINSNNEFIISNNSHADPLFFVISIVIVLIYQKLFIPIKDIYSPSIHFNQLPNNIRSNFGFLLLLGWFLSQFGE